MKYKISQGKIIRTVLFTVGVGFILIGLFLIPKVLPDAHWALSGLFILLGIVFIMIIGTAGIAMWH